MPGDVRAIVLDRHGRPDVLRVRTVPDPTPGPGEVRVRVEAIGVNFAEVLSRKGRYGWAPPIPYTPGMEATGTIELLGPGVEQRAIGERVIVGAQYGAYAEKMVVPARQALPAIADYSTEENNFTLALTTLSAKLDRRSLVIIFTDFVDPISAELMLRISSLTLPHGMFRVLLAEQLYRAWSITQNHPYHRA